MKTDIQQRFSIYMLMLAEVDLMLDEEREIKIDPIKRLSFSCHDGFCFQLHDQFGIGTSYEGVYLEDFPELFEHMPEEKHDEWHGLWFSTNIDGWKIRRKILINCIEKLYNKLF